MGFRRPLGRPACHWERIVQVDADGAAVKTLVWICEYPYRTILAEPTEDCHNRHEPVTVTERALQSVAR
jgi:hypothetical protein